MAVAEYQQTVLFTARQLALLKRLATGWLPPLNQEANWQCIDRLHKKGAIAQRGARLLLTDKGKWAINRCTKRVVLYHKRSKRVEEQLELADMSDAMMLNIEEVCEQGVGNGDVDEAVFADLVHDCVDYHKDNGKLPDPQDVQAWGEIVYAKVTIAQARRVVKEAEQELSRG